VQISRPAGLISLGLMIVALFACRDQADCPRCDTVVVAAVGEPASILPPLAAGGLSVGRDIGDQVYERLAVLEPGAAPIDTGGYRPELAATWERRDSLTWRFSLRPGARWQNGRPVTSEDVRFSFDAFADTALGAVSEQYLGGRVKVIPEDSTTFLIQFSEPSPEQLYDATYHVRVIPKHVWEPLPRQSWASDTTTTRLIGSGPFRVERWQRGQFLVLVADTAGGARPAVRRAVWRFASDPDAALNLVLSHEADLLEAAIGPERAQRAAQDSTLRLIPYPSATYGFLGFNFFDQRRRGPHPVLSDRETRRGLALGVDRSALAQSVFGEETKAPPGPMSRLLWIWSDSIRTLPYDTAAARTTLEAAGWRLARGEQVRRRGDRRLAFDILVPSTSASRRQLAVQLQEAWRHLGAEVTVTAVDFALFQERTGQGRFDTYIGAWLDEPTPRGLVDQWGRSGWAAINYGRYANPAFDSLLARAGRETGVPEAAALYRQAMETLNADVPAIFLYAPINVAVASDRIEHVEVDPYSWASGLREWKAAGP
jgi:peptide/nickel transport system substrate-binding protein